MAQNYRIKDFRVGDFKDERGNTWCEVVFYDIGEPVRWVVKEPSRVTLDTEVYGHIEEKTSQAGRPYQRFYRDQKPDSDGGSSQAGTVAKGKYPRDEETQESIARSVALKAAVDFYAPNETKPSTKIVLATAEEFLSWLHGNAAATTAVNEAKSPEVSTRSTAGWQRGVKDEPLPEPPADMHQPIGYGEEPANDDIPF